MSITVSAIRRALCFTSLAASAFLLSCPVASAQSDAPMYKTQSISGFAGYIRDHQDYTSGYDNGVMFGLDFTEHFRFIDPSLEARVNLASSNDVTGVSEHSYLFGPVITAHVGRIHPYGDFLVGLGTIRFDDLFNPSYTHDRSTVYSGGGGIEVSLVHNLRLKLDVQYQHWQLGTTAATEFTPVLAGAGIAYTIPFRPFRRHSDPAYR